MSSVNHYRRRSIRLPGQDYAQPGGYFVTACAHERANLFGEIRDGELRLNEIGAIVADAWTWLASQYPYVLLDEWIVMPNHLHGIIMMVEEERGGSRAAPTDKPHIKRKPLGQLVGAFKTYSTRRVNLRRGTPGAALWQRNYYEHVIRNERELGAIRQYIANNTAQWALDRENPASIERRLTTPNPKRSPK